MNKLIKRIYVLKQRFQIVINKYTEALMKSTSIINYYYYYYYSWRIIYQGFSKEDIHVDQDILVYYK